MILRKILIIIIISVLSVSALAVIDGFKLTVPINMTYYNTYYSNCELNQEQHLINNLITITGFTEYESGSTMTPYTIVKIGDKYLFDAVTKEAINPEAFMNKFLIITGYLGNGSIKVADYNPENLLGYNEHLFNAIYVTDVFLMKKICCNICCNTVSEYFSNKKYCFWYL